MHFMLMSQKNEPNQKPNGSNRNEEAKAKIQNCIDAMQ
jgi:hypothetical protein